MTMICFSAGVVSELCVERAAAQRGERGLALHSQRQVLELGVLCLDNGAVEGVVVLWAEQSQCSTEIK